VPFTGSASATSSVRDERVRRPQMVDDFVDRVHVGWAARCIDIPVAVRVRFHGMHAQWTHRAAPILAGATDRAHQLGENQILDLAGMHRLQIARRPARRKRRKLPISKF
jgi:hypothetical protein